MAFRNRAEIKRLVVTQFVLGPIQNIYNPFQVYLQPRFVAAPESGTGLESWSSARSPSIRLLS